MESVASLLASRRFVRDCARLSTLVMFDLRAGEQLPLEPEELRARERSAWFAPVRSDGWAEKPTAHAAKCEVRRQCAEWARSMRSEYDARVIEWCDTGVATEKACAVLELSVAPSLVAESKAAIPVLLVVFRGSKSSADWKRTNFNLKFQPLLPSGASTDGNLPWQSVGAGLAARYMPRLSSSHFACVGAGMWRAYAGRDGSGGPRAAVRAVLERRLGECRARGLAPPVVLLTGHSSGGALAALSAFDLLHTSVPVASTGVGLVTFAATRSFNRAFRRALDGARRGGQLAALRVTIGSDIVPRVPHGVLGFGGVHAIAPRLLLLPGRPPRFDAHSSARDADLWRHGIDPSSHTNYAALMGGELPRGRRRTVGGEAAWPVDPIGVRLGAAASAGSCTGDVVLRLAPGPTASRSS